MVHIKLSTIKRQLQEKMHYPTEHLFEDDEFLTLDEAFEVLLSGFGAWLVRSRRGTQAMISQARERGWLSEKYADMFTDYCIPGWKVI